MAVLCNTFGFALLGSSNLYQDKTILIVYFAQLLQSQKTVFEDQKWLLIMFGKTLKKVFDF